MIVSPACGPQPEFTSWKSVFGKCVFLNSVGPHNFPFINRSTIPFPSGNSILIRLSKTEFRTTLIVSAFTLRTLILPGDCCRSEAHVYASQHIYFNVYIYIYTSCIYIHCAGAYITHNLYVVCKLIYLHILFIIL